VKVSRWLSLGVIHLIALCLLILIGSFEVKGGEAVPEKKLEWMDSKDHGLSFIEGPHSLIVECGKGAVRISLKTGIAEFIDCDPDEATKALWNGLKPFFERAIEEKCKEKEQNPSINYSGKDMWIWPICPNKQMYREDHEDGSFDIAICCEGRMNCHTFQDFKKEE
jgi:hypothetical protein